MTKPNSFVMMELPGTGFGKKPSVLVSNSDSVAGSTSHDAVVEVAGVESVGVVTGAAVVSVVAEFVGAATGAAVFSRAVTGAVEGLDDVA
jgi:hypothetical protein